MLEHKIMSNARQAKTMDPRIILLNNDNEIDESQTLRLAIQADNLEVFKLFWDCYPQLYTEKHLLSVARYCLYLGRTHFLVHILASPTSSPIFLSSPIEARSAFVDLFDNETLQYATERSTIIQLVGQEPYTRLDKSMNDDRLRQLYHYIRNNEVDKLRELILATKVTGIAHLWFDIFDDEEEILGLADDNRITTAFLNPILLAVSCKSFDCLTYLVSTFGVRQSMRSQPLHVRVMKKFDLHFSNLMFPLILRGKDHDILNFLLKHEGFCFSSNDFKSFINQSIFERWH
jgi:hypothetical protein